MERSGLESRTGPAPGRVAAEPSRDARAEVARYAPRPLAARDVLRLQRVVGNRALARLYGKKPAANTGAEQRPMLDKGGKTDEPWVGPEGDRFVWDAFDRTLTIFTSP